MALFSILTILGTVSVEADDYADEKGALLFLDDEGYEVGRAPKGSWSLVHLVPELDLAMTALDRAVPVSTKAN